MGLVAPLFRFRVLVPRLACLLLRLSGPPCIYLHINEFLHLVLREGKVARFIDSARVGLWPRGTLASSANPAGPHSPLEMIGPAPVVGPAAVGPVAAAAVAAAARLSSVQGLSPQTFCS